MIDAEMFAFLETFRSVQRVFPLRGDEHEIRDVGASYFKALRRWPLREVQAGAEAWVQRGARFPKPAEWIQAIPKREPSAPVEALADDAAREWLDAERRRWEGEVCGCWTCQQARVTELQPTRFVPDVVGDQVRQARIGDRVVTAGHWAHGEELGRWYRAKWACWEAYSRLLASDRGAARQPSAPTAFSDLVGRDAPRDVEQARRR